MNIHVRIEWLSLDGLPLTPSQQGWVRAAVEAELARLLAAEGLSNDLRQGGAFPSVRGGDVELQDGSNPGHLGRQIASAVQRGIGQ